MGEERDPKADSNTKKEEEKAKPCVPTSKRPDTSERERESETEQTIQRH